MYLVLAFLSVWSRLSYLSGHGCLICLVTAVSFVRSWLSCSSGRGCLICLVMAVLFIWPLLSYLSGRGCLTCLVVAVLFLWNLRLPRSRRVPREALRGGIPGSFLEPLGRSWSHFVGIYRKKLTRSLKE